jgi:hypothetical protein
VSVLEVILQVLAQLEPEVILQGSAQLEPEVYCTRWWDINNAVPGVVVSLE